MAAESESKTEELLAVIREVRERVRSGSGRPPSIPDLMPILHARDAALGKVAAIGTVNPRPPGLLNNIIQKLKRLVARALDWHIRDQVEFNRAAVAALDAILEALNENNRALNGLSSQASSLAAQVADAREIALRTVDLGSTLSVQMTEVRDLGSHWHSLLVDWERKISVLEMDLLRNMAELNGAFQHRTAGMESAFRQEIARQHAAFSEQMTVQHNAFEQQIREFFNQTEGLIHRELRLVRQRTEMPVQPGLPSTIHTPQSTIGFDALAFAQRFRGDEDYVREKQKFYVPYFEGCRDVLDVGCGRGEFLELVPPARGIDLSQECVALCRSKGLKAEAADLFAHLAALPDGSLDGIFSAQVIEHLPPERVPEMIRLASAKLASGGRIAIETPNPECLAIFGTHFYLDPTHQRPVPPQLLAFYCEEAGFGDIRIERLSPAIESMPALAALPADFREAFFGALDYALLAKKL